MDIKVIILDFDGVIVKSNQIKHRAFEELFKGSPHYQEIMTYHYAHNAVDRHRKFKYIIENIEKQNYNEELAGRWADKFSQLTQEAIINCPYTEGALEFLEYFSAKLPLYIASATPKAELAIILEKRGLKKYFKAFYAAPLPKAEIFQNIAEAEKVAPKDILYIGDSPEDYQAARGFGCKFFAFLSEHKLEAVRAKKFKTMQKLKEELKQSLVKS